MRWLILFWTTITTSFGQNSDPKLAKHSVNCGTSNSFTILNWPSPTPSRNTNMYVGNLWLTCQNKQSDISKPTHISKNPERYHCFTQITYEGTYLWRQQPPPFVLPFSTFADFPSVFSLASSIWLLVWRSGNGLEHIHKVTLRWDRLVFGRVTVFKWLYHLSM